MKFNFIFYILSPRSVNDQYVRFSYIKQIVRRMKFSFTNDILQQK